jgi:hypothetical protein
MRVRKIALAGLLTAAGCTAETPLTPSSPPAQRRLDQAPADSTPPTNPGVTIGSGLLGSGH